MLTLRKINIAISREIIWFAELIAWVIKTFLKRFSIISSLYIWIPQWGQFLSSTSNMPSLRLIGINPWQVGQLEKTEIEGLRKFGSIIFINFAITSWSAYKILPRGAAENQSSKALERKTNARKSAQTSGFQSGAKLS